MWWLCDLCRFQLQIQLKVQKLTRNQSNREIHRLALMQGPFYLPLEGHKEPTKDRVSPHSVAYWNYWIHCYLKVSWTCKNLRCVFWLMNSCEKWEILIANLSRTLLGCRNEYTTCMMWSRAAITCIGGLNILAAATFCKRVLSFMSGNVRGKIWLLLIWDLQEGESSIFILNLLLSH